MTNGQQKKLLLIRPNNPDDYFTSKFSHYASEDLKNEAQRRRWEVTEL